MTRYVVFLVASSLLLLSPITNAKPYGSKICNDPEYTCYTVKKGDSWDKLFPDDTERDLVMRINRMNTSLYRGLTIAIPASPSSDILAFSPLPTQIDPPGTKLIYVSTKDLAFGAYDSNGSLEHWGPISSGKGYCPDVGRRCNTSKGRFEILYKKGKSCASTRYPVGRGGAPMPYCMFFNGNFALHGSYNVPGYNDSHGCVRLFINDAQWLNQEFTASGERTRVIIQ
jgi:hypothetical protein